VEGGAAETAGSGTVDATTSPAPATAAATAAVTAVTAAALLSVALSTALWLAPSTALWFALSTALSAGTGARFVHAGGAVPGAPSPKMSAVTAAAVTSASAFE
jgi:hypothetical protein